MEYAVQHDSTLKPCPFCGEKDELYPSYRNMGAGKPYSIDCLGCGIDFTPREGMDVIAMWNRRTTRQRLVVGPGVVLHVRRAAA